MSEQAHHTTPEDSNQQIAEQIDVMSLKQVEMTTEEYKQFVNMDADDPRVTDLFNRYGVTAGELIIVSTPDFVRVVATDETDLMTTNRLLTDQFNAQLEALNDTERDVSSVDTKIGGQTLAVVGVDAPHATREHETTKETNLNMGLLEGVIGGLYSVTENFRQTPEAEGRHHMSIYIMREATSAHDAFKSDKINAESYSVLASTLLGAAGNHASVETVVNTLLDAKVLDTDARADLSSHARSISEIAALTGLEGERARISYVNSLIAQSENLLEKNNYVANSRYKAMVGLIAGLSTQIKDYSTSSGFMNGALGRLKQYS